MKRLSIVLTALSIIAVAAPTVASAQNDMHKGRGMRRDIGMHQPVHRDMPMAMHHRHHHTMGHMMKKKGM